MEKRRIRILPGIANLAVLVALLGDFAVASDFLYEKQLSESVAESITDGEPVWLNLSQRSFLSLYLEAETKLVQGAVLIVPGISGHADSQGLVHGLRTAFPAKGWTSMSLQMPVRHPGDHFESYLSLVKGSGARIRSAIDYLTAMKVENVVLIGHGLGALMALDYMAGIKKPDITALVLIGMPVLDEKQIGIPLVATLKEIEIPVLDVYASRDLDTVITSVGTRRQSLKENEFFRQMVIEGANHEFQNDSDLLFKRIYSWITRSTPGVQDEKRK